MNIWDMTAGPMTPITPQWQGWVNDPRLTHSTTSLPGQAQARAGIPQPRFAGNHHLLTSQATQVTGVSQPHKSDTRAPPAAEGSSSHHSTPSEGKASTPRDSDQLLANANISGDTIKWLHDEGLGSIDHLKLLTLQSTRELCNGKSPKLPFGSDSVKSDVVSENTSSACRTWKCTSDIGDSYANQVETLQLHNFKTSLDPVRGCMDNHERGNFKWSYKDALEASLSIPNTCLPTNLIVDDTQIVDDLPRGFLAKHTTIQSVEKCDPALLPGIPATPGPYLPLFPPPFERSRVSPSFAANYPAEAYLY